MVVEEIETANGFLEVDLDLLADHTLTDLEVDNHGMRKSKEVEQAPREKKSSGVGLGLAQMIGWVDHDKVVKNLKSRIEKIVEKTRGRTKFKILTVLDMIGN